jgi:hypothetical protein
LIVNLEFLKALWAAIYRTTCRPGGDGLSQVIQPWGRAFAETLNLKRRTSDVTEPPDLISLHIHFVPKDLTPTHRTYTLRLSPCIINFDAIPILLNGSINIVLLQSNPWLQDSDTSTIAPPPSHSWFPFPIPHPWLPDSES